MLAYTDTFQCICLFCGNLIHTCLIQVACLIEMISKTGFTVITIFLYLGCCKMVQRTYLCKCYQTRMCGSLFWWTVIIAHGRNNAVGMSNFVRLGITGLLFESHHRWSQCVLSLASLHIHRNEIVTKPRQQEKNALKPSRLAFEKKLRTIA